MANSKYSEDFKKKVAAYYGENESSLKEVGEKFGVNPTLVRNWHIKFTSDTKSDQSSIKAGESLPELSDAVQRLIDDEADDNDAIVLLNSEPSEIFEAADELGEEPDYIIESALERMAQKPEFFSSLVEVVSEVWIKLDDLNGAIPFEIKVRCAEFIGAYNNHVGIGAEELNSLASSDDWTDRLIAGWTIRDQESELAVKIRTQLESDEFQDDNGIYLVREAVGAYEE